MSYFTSSSSKIVLCTGANQGLGFGILHVTGLRKPEYTYILCSRNLGAGKEAVKKLKDLGVTAKIDLVQLDVTNDGQITDVVRYVEGMYGRLDGKLALLLYIFSLSLVCLLNKVFH